MLDLALSGMKRVKRCNRLSRNEQGTGDELSKLFELRLSPGKSIPTCLRVPQPLNTCTEKIVWLRAWGVLLINIKLSYLRDFLKARHLVQSCSVFIIWLILRGGSTAWQSCSLRVASTFVHVGFICFCIFIFRIMVLDKGFVVEFDTPSNLLVQQGTFYTMAHDAGLA